MASQGVGSFPRRDIIAAATSRECLAHLSIEKSVVRLMQLAVHLARPKHLNSMCAHTRVHILMFLSQFHDLVIALISFPGARHTQLPLKASIGHLTMTSLRNRT